MEKENKLASSTPSLQNHFMAGQRQQAVQAGEEITLLNPRLDIVFKAMFSQDSADSKEALRGLVSALTGLPVKETTVLNNDIPIADLVVQKQIRLDVHCRTDTGETVDVEMQMEHGLYNLPNRMEYYAARLLSGQKDVDNEYTNLHKVYQILIADFKLVKTEEEPSLISTFKNQHGREFSNLQNLITLELPKIKLPNTDIEKIDDKDLETWYNGLSKAEQWGAFFRWVDDVKKNGRLLPLFEKTLGARNAGRILMDLSAERAAKELAQRRADFLMDYTSSMSASRRIGIEQGIERQKAEDQKIIDAQAAQISAKDARIRELEAQLAAAKVAVAAN